MDWIRKNFEKLILVAVSAALLGLTVLLLGKVAGFRGAFASVTGQVRQGGEIPPLDTGMIESALREVTQPKQWEQKGPLLSSRPYLVKDGKLVNPEDDDTVLINPPIPNKWFIENELDILEQGVKQADPDGDGFANVDEWQGKTNPRDKASHPPYFTKLRLEDFIQKKFRILFASYSGDTFQINTIDVRQPSQFLKLGDTIQGTKFKIVKFEEKSSTSASTGAKQDISELTIEQLETAEQIVLVLNVIRDSPDSFAKLRYLWDGSSFDVKKDKEFVLKPEEDVKYKLIEVARSKATIQQLTTNQTIEVPLLDQQNP